MIMRGDGMIRVRAVHQKDGLLYTMTMNYHARAAEKCGVTAASSSPGEQASGLCKGNQE